MDTLLRLARWAGALGTAIAAANVVLLLLSRAAARRQALAMRAALGAGRGRIARQLAAEGILLAVLGAALGLPLAYAALAALGSTWPDGASPWGSAGPAPLALAAGAGLPLLAVLAASLLPVGRAGRRDLARVVGTGRWSTGGPGEERTRAWLTGTAIAVSTALLLSAALLLRARMPAAGAGAQALDGRDTLVAQVRAPAGAGRADAAAFYASVLDGARGVPGARGSVLASPGAWQGVGTPERLVGICRECARAGVMMPVYWMTVRQHAVSPGFFRDAGVPLLKGRELAAGDRFGAPGAVVINLWLAEELFPNADPVGKTIRLRSMEGEAYTVVGVVGDLRSPGVGVADVPTPAAYFSALQRPPAAAALAVKAAGDPLDLAPAVRRVVAAADPRQPRAAVSTLALELARFAAPLRWFGAVLSAVAGVAALLAALGVAGVVAFAVARRTRELGVRAALGARPRALVALVLRRGLRLTAIGVAFGAVVAVTGVARVLQLAFYGVPLVDGPAYAAVALGVALVALLATLVPGLRASRVDPAVALRAE